jgi:hypothetical protein
MDFRDAVVVGVAEGTDKRDDVEAELRHGAGPRRFCLGTIRLVGRGQPVVDIIGRRGGGDRRCPRS